MVNSNAAVCSHEVQGGRQGETTTMDRIIYGGVKKNMEEKEESEEKKHRRKEYREEKGTAKARNWW